MRLFARRQEEVATPQVGEEAPEFNLPGAHGGQLRLSMRTVQGPVVVAFYRPWSEEDVAYFKDLAEKEDEINLASGSVAGIGIAEPDEAREFVRASGMKSYVLYDYVRVTSRQWGLLEKDREHGEHSRPAVFIVGPDRKIAHAWTGQRPPADELLEKVSEITAPPKKPNEEEEEEPEKAEGDEGAPKKKLSAEEREKIKAERRAARESGKSVKTGSDGEKSGDEAKSAPKKLSAEEREKIKAERRAAREAGKPVKGAGRGDSEESSEEKPAGEAPKKLSREEREKIKAERRARREEGKSLKTSGAEEGNKER